MFGTRREGVRVSTRHLDPPKRAGWVRVLPAHKRATALLRQYIESRVGCVDKSESSCCKTFLGALNAVQADDNAAGVELVIVNGPERGTVAIFCNMHGVGQIPWLPTLVMQGNDRLANIRRETGVSRVAFDPPTKER